MSRDIARYVRELRKQVARLEVPETVEQAFGPYRDDPVGFVRNILGAESATCRSDGTQYQFEILRDLAAHPRVCVRSGHGVGKSAIDAWAALWWLATRPFSRVVVVAPEFSRQVRAVLFVWGPLWGSKRRTAAVLFADFIRPRNLRRRLWRTTARNLRKL